ncbi:UDP-N-acetylmuramoyl-L-alanine--D-glutamate ligase [Desulfovibrio aminophilus]|nr:UDP-N-acetylmuramoyl-L-alanine--D-glutamate ligase [Desulfovibrio aminophilus]
MTTLREQAFKRLRGKRAVVVGAGKSGLAAARLLLEAGARVALADAKPEISAEVLGDLAGRLDPRLGAHTPEQFRDADLVVLSPGVPAKKIAAALAPVAPENVVAELEFASWFLEAPILAVTGTNGKTTTTTLISKMLEDAGKTVFTGGNIGTPLCEFILQGGRADVVVLEVSSFQLQNCRTFKPRVAMLLNFAPNHLDYHADMEEYLSAKLNLFARMDEDGTAILPEAMRAELSARRFTRARMVWFAPTDRFPAPHLHGAHNRANVEAAWQAVRLFGVGEESARATAADFLPLAHRLQTVAEKNGVLYVDDSKSTTLDSTAAAVKSFERPVRLLLGGVFKGGDVATLIPALDGRVVEIGLFGAARDIFEPILAGRFPLFWEPDLDKAVRRLTGNSRPGDVVLLSPATASFDAYTSYGARGDHFQRIVRELP